MSKVIKLTRGLDLPMSGVADQKISAIQLPDLLEVVPDHFVGIKPKVLVHEGDIVTAGQPLFCDKLMPEMMFVSPVSGKVKAINRGERRKVLSISIETDKQQVYEKYESQLEQMSGSEIRALLLKSGLWSVIHQRPYDCITSPASEPKAVFVSSFDSAPLAPDYAFIAKFEKAELQAGLTALSKMAGKPVQFGIRHGADNEVFSSLKDVEVTEFAGPHPAGNVGVQINHLDPVNKGEVVWTVNLQDVIIIGRLLNQGFVDMSRTVALTGPEVLAPEYLKVMPGTPLKSVFEGRVKTDKPLRYVAGNVLSGHKAELSEYVSPADNQFTVIDDGSETHEFMGWLAPRFARFSANRSLPSAFLRRLRRADAYQYDARMLGGRRAIIVSGEYDKVLPMDIYPEYLIKAMIAGNLDKMEQLGAYEVAPEDFALCEYVCTSKLPLQAIVRQALDNMKSELE